VRRGGVGGLAGNPVLVGAITVLITVVAVFLAYNANSGLPFVPVYELDAKVPNASGLIRGNEVRVGGTRVGMVGSIDPIANRDGTVGATLHLKLDRSLNPIPADSRILIRPRSPLGLKYIEVTLGRSRHGLAQGAAIPLAPASPTPVEIDDFFNIFSKPVREGARSSLDEIGTGLAGRGPALNTALAQLDPLVTRLEPVMRNLLGPRTRLRELFPALERAAREVAPVATQQASLFVGLDRTFASLAQVTQPIQESIALGPAALDTATHELAAQEPFVEDTTELFRRLRPSFESLGAASTRLAPALDVAQPVLRRVPALDARLESTFSALDKFAGDLRVVPALDRLAETATLLRDPIAFATPAQTTCNYLTLFFRNLQSSFSEGDTVGTFLRFGILGLPQNPNSEAGPSSGPADGPPVNKAKEPLREDSFLHSNPYPNTAAPGQPKECEAGNETYVPGRQAIGNDPKTQPASTEKTARSLK
jgi:phospholipid/cholesterol/gamma-HCH transport system substrate-binding protein